MLSTARGHICARDASGHLQVNSELRSYAHHVYVNRFAYWALTCELRSACDFLCSRPPICVFVRASVEYVQKMKIKRTCFTHLIKIHFDWRLPTGTGKT